MPFPFIRKVQLRARKEVVRSKIIKSPNLQEPQEGPFIRSIKVSNKNHRNPSQLPFPHLRQDTRKIAYRRRTDPVSQVDLQAPQSEPYFSAEPSLFVLNLNLSCEHWTQSGSRRLHLQPIFASGNYSACQNGHDLQKGNLHNAPYRAYRQNQ